MAPAGMGQLSLLRGPGGLRGPLLELVDALSRAAGAAASVTLFDARALVAEHLVATGAVASLSLNRFTTLWARFERYAANGFGVTLVADVDAEVVGAFVHARTATGHAPSPATSHLRRTALRLLFRVLRELRLARNDPTLDLVLPPRAGRQLRPLTDEEVELCRWAALTTLVATRRPAVWALAEAGAATAEVGSVTRADLDLPSGRVWVAGSAKTDPRWLPVTSWGAVQLARHADLLSADGLATPLTYGGRCGEPSHRTSTAATITAVLRRAGLGGDRDLGPRSVTAWVGCGVLAETGRIEEVARRLGLRSLDLAADLVGFHWRPEGGGPS